MPIVEVEGQKFQFPDGTTDEVIGNAIRDHFGTQPEESRGITDIVTSMIPGGEALKLGLNPKIAEPVAAIATGIVAEPVSGVTGLAASLTPGLGEGIGADVVESVREGLTFSPKTQEGRQSLQSVGKFVEPVASVVSAVEEGLGSKTFEATGSPALAAAAKTIPTAIMEVLGVAGVKGGLKAGKAVKRAKITRELNEAVPSVDQLKDVSRSVYKEIDDLGVTLKPPQYKKLVEKINIEAKKAGADPTITPKTMQALNRFNERIGDSVSLTEVDTLRKVAGNAAKSLEPAEAALGARMIDTLDQFLDQANPRSFNGPKEAVKGLGKKYKVARDLWGRARRSELLEEAFTKARNQASGFENGVRIQFRSILNNKRQRRFFKPDEIAAIQRVVRGDKTENLAKLIGRLGFSEGGAMNIVGGALGATAGGIVGGAPGAVIVPLVGQLSRKLAQRMTARNARFADQVVRAGKDARKIVKSYLDNTPAKLRDSAELSELLMRSDIDLSLIPRNQLSLDAARLATERRTMLAAAATAGAATPREEQ